MTTSMPTPMLWVVIVTVLALLQFIAFGGAVGWARFRHKIHAPATTGHEVFERFFRVQMNTLEQLVLFVPALWLFAVLVSPTWAAALGGVYLVGRVIYFLSYIRDPKSRSLGFALTQMPTLVMMGGVLIDVIAQLLGRPLT